MCDVFNFLKLWNMKFIFENFETRDTWGPKWLPGYVRSTWMACLFSNSFTLKKWTPISKMWCRNSYYCMYNFGCKLLSYSILKFIFQSWNKLQFWNKKSDNSFFFLMAYYEQKIQRNDIFFHFKIFWKTIQVIWMSSMSCKFSLNYVLICDIHKIQKMWRPKKMPIYLFRASFLRFVCNVKYNVFFKNILKIHRNHIHVFLNKL